MGVTPASSQVRHPYRVQVIIIGAGEIGWYLAEILAAEHHDVSVVELDPGRAAQLASSLDVQVIVGSGSSPAVLEQAGIASADFLAGVFLVAITTLPHYVGGRSIAISNTDPIVSIGG